MARETTRKKVYTAALALAADVPVRAITMEGIAARAAVSKQTLYRSWPSTGVILFNALLSRSTREDGSVAVPNSGDLSNDLQALAIGMIGELTEPSHGGLLRAVTAELQSDENLATDFLEVLLEPQLRAISNRLREAGVPAPDDVAELFVGPIFYRWLLRTRPFSSEWVAAHVDRTVGSTVARQLDI